MALEAGTALRGRRDRPRLHRLVHERPPRATCARPPRSCAGKRVASRRAGDGRAGLDGGQGGGRGRGPRPRLRRRRLRVAQRRLLDVPRHEPRHPASRASAAPRPRNRNFEGRQGAAAARTSCRPRWPPPRRSPATSSTSGAGADGAVRPRHRDGRGARPRQRRHRPDHPEAVPASGSSAPASASSCSGTGAKEPDFPLNRPEFAARRSSPRAQLRLGQLARARALGPRRVGLPRDRRAVLRRHLPHQLLEERAALRGAARGRRARADRPRAGRGDRRPRAAGRGRCRRAARSRSTSTPTCASGC